MSRFAAPVAAPVAALLLVAALGVGGCGGQAAPTSQPAMTWEQVDPDPNGNGGPSSLASWSGGTVGVGGNRVWHTADGRSWTSIPLPVAAADDAHDLIIGLEDHARGIVATQDRLIAVGSVADAPAIWISSDGETWERLEDDDLHGPAGHLGLIGHVAAGPAGIVAVGTVGAGDTHQLLAWWSADGRDWVRATTAIVGFRVMDVIAGPDGFVMAVDGDGPRKASFWHSADGRVWNVAVDHPSFLKAVPSDLAMRDGTIVAVGWRSSGSDVSPAAWTSPDGHTWTAAPAAPALASWPFPGPTPVQDRGGAPSGSEMSGVLPTETGFLAVGMHYGYGLDPSRPQLRGFYDIAARSGMWQSPDGLAWELVPNDLLVGHFYQDPSYLGSVRLGVGEINGAPVIIGATPDQGVLLWLGSAASE
jgi:hypothetical protein